MAEYVLTAQLAVESLIEQGLRTFAAFCDSTHVDGDRLHDQFQAILGNKGHACNIVFFSCAGKSEMEKRIRIARHLGDLPKPVGIFAGDEAQMLLETCQLAGYSIPEEVAIIAFDQDQHLSVLPFPPQSDPLHAADKDHIISAALEFIHDKACDGITVMDVLNEVPLSRRVLEHRFRKVLGKTPHEEIISARLKRVKQLLAETDMTLGLIADRTGFKHTEYLSVAFKREVGFSPSQYRKLHNRRQQRKITVNY